MADSIVMTPEERAAFLADVHTGVVSIPDGDRGPLSVPIWYRVDDDGDVVMVTPTDSRKARLCEVGTRISLVAQDEALPPKYVSVEGPVVAVEPASTLQLNGDFAAIQKQMNVMSSAMRMKANQAASRTAPSWITTPLRSSRV